MIQSIAKFKKRFDENVEDTDQLDEKLIGQQKFDNAKVLAGAMSRDAYDKKYKLGKYQKR